MTAPFISGSFEDRQAVVEVTIAYCWALDSRDWDALDHVFLPDATAALGSNFDGLEAIKDRVTSALTPLDSSQHVVTNHHVHIDGDRATCRCYLVAQHTVKGAEGGPNFVVAGRYDDALERTAAGWRIRRRDLTVIWTEGNSAVLYQGA